MLCYIMGITNEERQCRSCVIKLFQIRRWIVCVVIVTVVVALADDTIRTNEERP
jgi:hypothetical protein